MVCIRSRNCANPKRHINLPLIHKKLKPEPAGILKSRISGLSQPQDAGLERGEKERVEERN